MAKLDLPFRAYLEDFASRAFPNRTFARGTAANDLVIKAGAVILQPLRHEIDALKVNQSIANYRYLTVPDMDALAANWGAFRKTGGVATGTIRLFFDTIADYQLNYLQFMSDDGVTFQLQAPVTIPATALLQTQSTGTIPTYSFDVTVVSVGIGSRYTVAANTITRAINPPANLIRCTNPEAFSVTAPNETNYDLVNRMFRDLGLKNRVSRASIRSPIFDQFPGVLDVLVAGATHPKMLRDLQEVRLPDGTITTLHLGGKADVWLNTLNTVTYVQTFGYLPSSRTLRLVTAQQAAARDATYSFARALVTVDSTFATPDPTIEPDESMALQVMQAGLPTSATVVSGLNPDRTVRIAGSDLTRGEGAFGLGHPTNLNSPAPVLFDPENNFTDVGVAAGDMIFMGGDFYAAVARVSPNVLELCPGSLHARGTVNPGIPHPMGSRFLSLSAVETFPVSPTTSEVTGPPNRVLISTGEAQGFYRVIEMMDEQNYVIGTPLSECTLAAGTFVSTDPSGLHLYSFVVTAGTVDLQASASCSIFVGQPSQLLGATDFFRITSITRGAVTTIYALVPGSTPTPAQNVTIVQGLRGTLLSTDTVSLQFDTQMTPLQADVRPIAKRFTPYANAFDADFDTVVRNVQTVSAAATNVLLTLSATHAYLPGQLLTVTATGGSGWSDIVRVKSVPSPTTLEVTYDTAPTGMFSSATVVRNVLEAPGIGLSAHAGDVLLISAAGATYAPGSTAGGDGPFASLPILPFPQSGLRAARARDWIVLGGNVQATFPIGTPYAVQVSQPAALASRSATAANVGGTGRLTFAAPLGAGLGDGTGLILTTSAGEVVTATASTASGARTLTFAGGKVAQVITFSAGGYSGPTASAIGQLVVQADGTSLVRGILVEFNNAVHTWTVTLENPAAPFLGGGGHVTLATGLYGGAITGVAAFANGPAGATDKFGYWPPAPADVTANALVRQGSYTGTLMAGTDTSATGGVWLVKPTSDADLFDSTTEVTFVDNGTYLGFPVTTGNARKNGILSKPASAPSLTGAAPMLTLDRPLATTGALTVDFRPRFPATGGLFATNQMRVSGQTFAVGEFSAVNPSVGASDPTGLTVNLGANTGAFNIVSAGASALDLGTTVGAELSRLPNAGPATQITGITAAAGNTAITLPGTDWGFWAAPGRILVLSVAGTTYYLETNGQGGTTADVLLAAPLPVTLNSGQPVTVEVVDGFITPFMLPNRSKTMSYRLTRPPTIAGEVYAAGGTLAQTGGATTAATSVFEGGNVDYRATLLDAGVEGLFLHLDSGPEAQPEPIPITGFNGTSTFTVDHVFTDTALNVAYHISYRPRRHLNEKWFSAQVVADGFGGGKFRLIDADPLVVAEYNNSEGLVQVLVETSAGGTAVQGGVITTISGQDISVNAAGDFGGPLIGTFVRLSCRLDDRAQAQSITGSLLATYDYYAGGYMTLPLVRVQKVEVLDATNGQVLNSVPFTLEVHDAGLRYSHQENISLFIEDSAAIYQPMRVTYSADASIEAVDNFLNDFHTKVENANQMAKRMETLLINVDITVRSTLTASAISSQLAQYINTRPSTQTMAKDGLIQFLYQNSLVTGVSTDLFVLSGTYYQLDGAEVNYVNAAEIFGADTACYVAGSVNVVLA